jgi:hypothetical protein
MSAKNAKNSNDIENIKKLLSKLKSKVNKFVELKDVENIEIIERKLYRIYDDINKTKNIIIETDRVIDVINKNIKKRYLHELYDDNEQINIECVEYNCINYDNGAYNMCIEYAMELTNNNIIEICCSYDNNFCEIYSEIDISNENTDVCIINKDEDFKIEQHNCENLNEIFKFKKIDVYKFVELFHKIMQREISI